MPRRSSLTLAAIRAALALRHQAGIQPDHPTPVYDVASECGLEVRFEDLPSVEGMYVSQVPPLVILSSLRPAGRQAMNCAHEVGHHVFNHGTRLDRYLEEGTRGSSFDAEEHLANMFASFLLMPKAAVIRGFLRRGFDIKAALPDQVYRVSTWLGVGYTALIYQMEASLNLIGRSHAAQLLGVPLSRIRAMIRGLPDVDVRSLIPVDTEWVGRPIDVQVGDEIIAPAGSSFDGACGTMVNGALRATTPGIGRLEHAGWASFVRVSRSQYVGLAQYRHLEDVVNGD